MKNDVYVGFIKNDELDVKILVLAGDIVQAQAKAFRQFSTSLKSHFHAEDVQVQLFSAA